MATTQQYSVFPFFAVITANHAGHEFKKGQIVKIERFYTTFRGINYYHALDSTNFMYLVQEEDFELTKKSF